MKLVRALGLMTIVLAILAASSASARKASHHYSKRTTAKHQSAPKSDPAAIASHPDDVALDRKIGSICRGAEPAGSRQRVRIERKRNGPSSRGKS
jgi:hypothetical protein